LGVPTVADRVHRRWSRGSWSLCWSLAFIATPSGTARALGARCGSGGAAAELGIRLGGRVDIRGLFDNIDHALLLKAVRKHCLTPWVLLYIERWLKVPMEMEDGTRVARTCGTPQGGV